MLLPVPATVSISSNAPRYAPETASDITCSRDGVLPSRAQPSTRVSQASRPIPLLASTNNSGEPTELIVPAKWAFAVAAAWAAGTLAVVDSVKGATKPTDAPANAPSGLVWTIVSPP